MKNSFLYGLAACFLLASALPALGVPVLTHEYTFDVDLSDGVGALTADPLGSGVVVEGAAGIDGGAAHFMSAGDMLVLPDQSVLSPGAWTVSFWEMGELGAGETYNTGYFLSDAGANTSNVTNLFARRFAYNTDPKLVGPNGMVGGSNGQFTKSNPPELPLGVWNHHMITVEDGGVSEWYINGDLAAETLVPGLWDGLLDGNADGNSGTSGLCLGNRAVDGNRTFHGYLDEVQVYDGAAHEGMAEYLSDNPGANLTTYDAVSYPDPNPGTGTGTVPPGATVYRWQFDGNMDEDGGVYNGSPVGNATVGTDNGIVGGAVYFDGNDDAVSISKEVVPDGSATFSFWSKAHADGTAGYLISDSDDVTNLLYRRYTSSDSTSRFTGWVNGSSYGEYPNPDGESWPNEEWIHHAIVISEEDQYVAFYINGDLREIKLFEVGAPFEWDGFVSDLYLGNRANLSRDYKGWLDEVQVYNFALDYSQVDFLAKNPGAVVPEPAVLSLLLALGALICGRSGRRV